MTVAEVGFPRARRLLQSAQFEHVFARSCKAGESCVTVLARANDLPYPRLGLVVSKRSAKKAVMRNRIKRLAREVFRHLQDRLGGVDLIVISRAHLADRSKSALAELFSKYFVNAASRCRKS